MQCRLVARTTSKIVTLSSIFERFGTNASAEALFQESDHEGRVLHMPCGAAACNDSVCIKFGLVQVQILLTNEAKVGSTMFSLSPRYSSQL